MLVAVESSLPILITTSYGLTVRGVAHVGIAASSSANVDGVVHDFGRLGGDNSGDLSLNNGRIQVGAGVIRACQGDESCMRLKQACSYTGIMLDIDTYRYDGLNIQHHHSPQQGRAHP